jgi:alkanesulfonate monooxygenase SsuD/methylene tetrahydromethanopterin reductase-like flavin-dependent oxidoreductase (luciferase family)
LGTALRLVAFQDLAGGSPAVPMSQGGRPAQRISRRSLGIERPGSAGNAFYWAPVDGGLKLSAFSVVDGSGSDLQGAGDRLLRVVQLAEVAESSGLSTLWVAEHHFHAGGVCPSPPVLLAACGARTRRIRLGALVSVLPFHRPIDLAEEYAMVDRLSGGRLNLGVGSGYIPTEFEGFGVDPETKRVRFEASLETILTAFAGGEIRAEGERGAPVRLNVLPLQRPRPPLWIAVQRREAIPHVARKGVSLALVPYATLAGTDELAAEIREFRQNVPAGLRTEVAVALHLYGGEHPEAARRSFRRYLESRLETRSRFYAEKARHDPQHATPESIESSGFALFGSAEDVARRLRTFKDLGVDEVLGIFDFGGLEPDEVHGSVRALGAAWRRS